MSTSPCLFCPGSHVFFDQAQYDRVLEQEKAIDAAAEQSLSRKTSTQAQTLIRAHRSGNGLL